MGTYVPIIPVKVLQSLLDSKLVDLGPTHMLIAPEIVRNERMWVRALDDLDATQKELQIILDNGVYESGSDKVDMQMLERAVDIVQPDYTILPDVMGDREQTVERSLEAVAALGEPKYGKYAIVAQGQSVIDHLACISEIMVVLDREGHRNWIGMICVPKITVKTLGSRAGLVRRIHKIWTTLPIHLLGWSAETHDDIAAASVPGVVGIDSATPIWQGYSQYTLSPAAPVMYMTPSRPTNFWDFDHPSKVTLKVIAYNIEVAGRWFDGEQAAEQEATTDQAVTE